MKTMLRILPRVSAALVVLFLLSQLVPFGHDHANPAVVQEPPWSSPAVRQLAVRACYDCHSNETIWPWYSSVAPFPWLLQRDVLEGREHMNFSDWGDHALHYDELPEVMQEHSMPPIYYLPLHPSAALSEQEYQDLTLEMERLSTLVGGGHSSHLP